MRKKQKNEVFKVSENKENFQMQQKVICWKIKLHVKKKKHKNSLKKIEIVVDRKVVLRYNVTRWRQMRFGAWKMTYEPVYYSII